MSVGRDIVFLSCFHSSLSWALLKSELGVFLQFSSGNDCYGHAGRKSRTLVYLHVACTAAAQFWGNRLTN